MCKIGYVNKIIPFSCVDGEGNRTAIFLQGCNFNCAYCHNPETINVCNGCGSCIDKCPVGALSMEAGKVVYDKSRCVNCDTCIRTCNRNASPKIIPMTVKDIVSEVEKNRVFISGITVSGGECTLQSDFLIDLFKEIKKMGLTTFVDTNGSTEIYKNKELLEVMDKTMIDLKAYEEEDNINLVGMTNKTVIENIKVLGAMDKVYEIRTVVVPEVLNNEHTVDMGSKLLASINPEIIYKLIKYRPIGVREDRIQSYTPSDEYMENLKNIALNNGCKNVIIV